MGWTGCVATYYKDGKIDRKAECDSYFTHPMNLGCYEVVKSAMVGSTYYAAIKQVKRRAKDENGKVNAIDIPVEDQKTFCAVFLTTTKMKEDFNFYYKEMSEDMNPCNCDCPAPIFELLSPTDDEYALAWRARCKEAARRKKSPSALGKLPLGSVIRFNVGDRERCYMKCPPSYQFKTPFWYCNESGFYIPKKNIPKDYKVIRYGYGY